MNEKQVRNLIETVLAEKTQGGEKPALPQGYNPLEIIRGAMFQTGSAGTTLSGQGGVVR